MEVDRASRHAPVAGACACWRRPSTSHATDIAVRSGWCFYCELISFFRNPSDRKYPFFLAVWIRFGKKSWSILRRKRAMCTSTALEFKQVGCLPRTAFNADLGMIVPRLAARYSRMRNWVTDSVIDTPERLTWLLCRSISRSATISLLRPSNAVEFSGVVFISSVGYPGRYARLLRSRIGLFGLSVASQPSVARDRRQR